MKNIEFIADKVKIKVGHRVDGSAEVTFEVGEHMVANILPLGVLSDCNLRIAVTKDE